MPLTLLMLSALVSAASAVEVSPSVEAWTPVLARLGAAGDPASPWARLAVLPDLPAEARELVVPALAEALQGVPEERLTAALEREKEAIAAAAARRIAAAVDRPGATAAADWAAAALSDARFLPLRARAAEAAGRERASRVAAVAGAWAPEEKEAVRAFMEERHESLRRGRPDLFLKKMRKAAASDFAFYRGFPDLYYKTLRAGADAPRLAATPELLLDGDLHAENVELVDGPKGRTPQANDFDDAGRGPAALDIARVLGSAALLSSPGGAAPAELVSLAAQAYASSLAMSFERWVESVQDEKAVAEAKNEDRDWPRNAGTSVRDEALSRRLYAAAGVERESSWKLFDRIGAGLSSIGVLRYMFASVRHSHALELKQLRASALEFFSGRPQGEADTARVAEAFARLRQVPAEARTLSFEGSDWALRRREGRQRALALEHARSAARVLGGLAAQLHRRQADRKALEAAVAAVSVRLVLDALAAMARARRIVAELLREGVWEARG